jgi:hypothetical protein
MSAWQLDELEVHKDVECVEMPCCGFVYAKDHTNLDGSYTCPLCTPDKLSGGES